MKICLLYYGVLVLPFLPYLAGQQCPEPDGQYADPRQCDRYIECRDGIPQERLCPDGLVFNDRLTVRRYPCDYPIDVDCGQRTSLQRAVPFGNCPHQWGIFRKGNDPGQCGQFFNCVGGREFLFDCPEGLAFSSLTYRCEWPDESPDCDAEAFLGFRCPTADQRQLFLFTHPRFPHARDCTKFYQCIDGVRPRLHTCPFRRVFNPAVHACDEQENVPGCENTFAPLPPRRPN